MDEHLIENLTFLLCITVTQIHILNLVQHLLPIFGSAMAVLAVPFYDIKILLNNHCQV